MSEQDRRIVVVRIIDRLNVGGPALHAVLTSAGLDPRRYRTLLLYGEIEAGEGDMGYLLAQHNVTAVHVPHLSRELRPLRDLRALVALWRVLMMERPQVVHTHKTKAGLLGRLAAVASFVPVRVHTYHGHVLEGYFGPTRNQAMVAMERVLSRLSTRLVTLSDRLRDKLSHDLGIADAAQFAVVPLGLDLAACRAGSVLRGRLRAELGIGAEVPLVGIVGRMVPIKDHLTFVRGFAQLTLAGVHAVFVGAGAGEGDVRAELLRLGVLDRAHLLGWRTDLPQIYADLDVLALTSRNEGTPVAVIEALSAGVPVVATAVGGVPDVLREGRGVLVPPGDPAALARALGSVLTDPTARSRAQAQQDMICTEYGIERLCQDLDTLYTAELRRLGELRAEPLEPTTWQARGGKANNEGGGRLSAWPTGR